MKVRALKPHNNKFGDNYRKAEGDEYEAPDAAATSLAAQGLVVAVDQGAAPAPAPKTRRTSPKAN